MRDLTPDEAARIEEMTNPVAKAKFAWDDTFQSKC